jgi:hypothetical protein
MMHPEQLPLVAARLARDPRLAERLAYFYERLRALPRAGRRAFGRRARLTLAAAALLLALSRAPVIPPAHADSAATIAVANNEVGVAANGVCSLIEAINNANDPIDGIANGAGHGDCAAGNPGGADTIALPTGGTFSVSQSVDDAYGDTGLPPIVSAITIQGNGSTINRTGAAILRFLTVVAGGDLTLNNLTLTAGSLPNDAGGAVYVSDGQLTLDDCTITGNEGSAGGAIYAAAANVTILDSTISGNEAVNGNGGGVYILGGNVTISYLTATDNIASSGGGFGGGLSLVEAEATITAVAVTGNTASFGGGVAVSGVDGEVTIDGGAIAANEASESGGGIYVMDATLRLGQLTISDNSAATLGGGVYGVNSALTLTGVTVSGNSAGSNGGGLALVPLQGKAGEVRAVAVAAATIANSTISGNAAETAGGGIHNEGNMTLINATVSGNTAGTQGGGIITYGGALALRRTLISGNTAPTGREARRQAGSVNVASFNLFGFGGNAGLSGFSAGATDVVASPPLAAILGPLGSNGGPTLTHALRAGSPALDRAPSADCLAQPVNGTDQRGYPRNVNANGAPSANECDIGAFEVAFKVEVPVILR